MIFWASPDSSHHTKAVAIFSPVVTNVLDLPLPPPPALAHQLLLFLESVHLLTVIFRVGGGVCALVCGYMCMCTWVPCF